MFGKWEFHDKANELDVGGHCYALPLWEPSPLLVFFGVSFHDELLLLSGEVEVDRKGRLRGQKIHYRVPWNDVESWSRSTIEHPAPLQPPKSDAVSIHMPVRTLGAPTLTFLQAPDHWADVIQSKGVRRKESD